MTTSVTMPIHTRNVLAAAAEALFILCDLSRELFGLLEHRWSDSSDEAALERKVLDSLNKQVGMACAWSRRAVEWKRQNAHPETDLPEAHTAVSKAKMAVSHELTTNRFARHAEVHGTLTACYVSLCIMERLLGLARDGR